MSAWNARIIRSDIRRTCSVRGIAVVAGRVISIGSEYLPVRGLALDDCARAASACWRSMATTRFSSERMPSRYWSSVCWSAPLMCLRSTEVRSITRSSMLWSSDGPSAAEPPATAANWLVSPAGPLPLRAIERRVENSRLSTERGLLSDGSGWVALR